MNSEYQTPIQTLKQDKIAYRLQVDKILLSMHEGDFFHSKWLLSVKNCLILSGNQHAWDLGLAKAYSCIDVYPYSCLHTLSNERKSMFKSGDSRAV